MLDKRTGAAKFWSVSETPKQLASIELPTDESSAGRELRHLGKAGPWRCGLSDADHPLPPPGTMGAAFDRLAEAGILDAELRCECARPLEAFARTVFAQLDAK